MYPSSNPNPLAVFGLRRVDHCPPHFYPVRFDSIADTKKITDWIWENLSGRFHFDDVYGPSLTSPTNTIIQKCAAFEIHSEASYFALLLVDLNKHT